MKTGQTNHPCPLSVKLSLEEYQSLLDRVKLVDRLTQEKEQSLQVILSQEQLNRELRWENVMLKRMLWGRSSEKRRLPEDPDQLNLCFDEPAGIDPVKVEEKVVEAQREEKHYNRFRKNFAGKKKSSHSRQPIPEHLPRMEQVLEPEVDLTGAVELRKEVSERYLLVPRTLVVERIVRPSYKLPDGRIVTAPLPLMAHPRSNASESVLAHIAVSKYADHLPLHRQIEIFTREGITLAPSTVSNWMTATAQCIEPIYNELRETMKDSRYVQADETPHKVLETDRPGSLHSGYMWAFYLPHCKSPYFEYHKGRGASAVGTLLSGKTRIVQSDGFTVYDVFDKLPGYLHLCCWAHVRRKFVEAREYDPPASKYALEEIGKLYAVEKEIREKGLKKEEAVALRCKISYPVIKRLEQWAEAKMKETFHDSPLGKALSYMYNRFEQLSHYVNDAELSIDNNAVERAIRPLTLNRKNCLFSGSHDAAHCAAIFFSLLGACKENGVDPYAWLKDCLLKVKTCDPKDYSMLLPHNWKKN